MASAHLVLRFPPELVGVPLAGKFVREFDLDINILKARIEPDEGGTLVLALEGEPDDIRRAVEHARGIGVTVEELTREVDCSEERCTHCTACVGVCPGGALSVDRSRMTVTFDREKCIGCRLCVPACPYAAITVSI